MHRKGRASDRLQGPENGKDVERAALTTEHLFIALFVLQS